MLEFFHTLNVCFVSQYKNNFSVSEDESAIFAITPYRQDDLSYMALDTTLLFRNLSPRVCGRVSKSVEIIRYNNIIVMLFFRQQLSRIS